jgi:hypothetical protein
MGVEPFFRDASVMVFEREPFATSQWLRSRGVGHRPSWRTGSSGKCWRWVGLGRLRIVTRGKSPDRVRWGWSCNFLPCVIYRIALSGVCRNPQRFRSARSNGGGANCTKVQTGVPMGSLSTRQAVHSTRSRSQAWQRDSGSSTSSPVVIALQRPSIVWRWQCAPTRWHRHPSPRRCTAKRFGLLAQRHGARSPLPGKCPLAGRFPQKGWMYRADQ